MYDDEPTEKQLAFLERHGVEDAEFLTFEEASEQIEELIGGFGLATDRQRRYLRALGAPWWPTMSREEASAQIDAAIKASPATMKQKLKMLELGIRPRPGLTRAEADAVIDEALGW